DLFVGEVGGHGRHDGVGVGALAPDGAVAEGGERVGQVGGVLAADGRPGRARVAGAGRAVAGGAGRHGAVGLAAAEDLLAHGVELAAGVRALGDHAVVGDARQNLLGGEVGADV